MIERNAARHSLLQYLLYEKRQAELFKRICKADTGVSYFSIALALQTMQKHARTHCSNKIKGSQACTLQPAVHCSTGQPTSKAFEY